LRDQARERAHEDEQQAGREHRDEDPALRGLHLDDVGDLVRDAVERRRPQDERRALSRILREVGDFFGAAHEPISELRLRMRARYVVRGRTFSSSSNTYERGSALSAATWLFASFRSPKLMAPAG